MARHGSSAPVVVRARRFPERAAATLDGGRRHQLHHVRVPEQRVHRQRWRLQLHRVARASACAHHGEPLPGRDLDGGLRRVGVRSRVHRRRLALRRSRLVRPRLLRALRGRTGCRDRARHHGLRGRGARPRQGDLHRGLRAERRGQRQRRGHQALDHQHRGRARLRLWIDLPQRQRHGQLLRRLGRARVRAALRWHVARDRGRAGPASRRPAARLRTRRHVHAHPLRDGMDRVVVRLRHHAVLRCGRHVESERGLHRIPDRAAGLRGSVGAAVRGRDDVGAERDVRAGDRRARSTRRRDRRRERIGRRVGGRRRYAAAERIRRRRRIDERAARREQRRSQRRRRRRSGSERNGPAIAAADLRTQQRRRGLPHRRAIRGPAAPARVVHGA
jgi:hypothetical protein